MKTLIALFTFIVFLAGQPTPARANFVPFDWQTEWGTIQPDTGIPSDLHTVKQAINNAVERCGIGNTNYGLIKTFRTVVSGQTLYVIDPTAYFTAGQKAGCNMKPCVSGYGCYLSFMGPKYIGKINKACDGTMGEKEIISEETTTTEDGEEDVIVKMCENNLYNYPLVWEERVLSWRLMGVSEFATFRTQTLDAMGNTKYRAPINGNDIYVLEYPNGCTVDEMDFNNDGLIDEGQACHKYMQYAGNQLVDLYYPWPATTAENDTRYTSTLFDRNEAQIDGKDSTFWRETGKKFVPTETVSYQFPSFYESENEEPIFLCEQYTNNDPERSFFIPTRSDAEFQSFRNAVKEGQLKPYVTIGTCDKRFTPWSGTTTCPSVPCNSTVTIAAERRCQRSTSAYGECGECSGVADPQPLPGFANQCFFREVCRGPVCGGNGGADCLASKASILMTDGTTKPMKELKVGDKVTGFTGYKADAPLKEATITAIKITPFDPKEGKAYVINGVFFTAEHRLLTPENTVVRASSLTDQDKLVTGDGLSQNINKIEKANEEGFVYNLSLEGADGFIVEGLRVFSMTE